MLRTLGPGNVNRALRFVRSGISRGYPTRAGLWAMNSKRRGSSHVTWSSSLLCLLMRIGRIERIQLARRFYIRLGFLSLDRSFVLNPNIILYPILVTQTDHFVIPRSNHRSLPTPTQPDSTPFSLPLHCTRAVLMINP